MAPSFLCAVFFSTLLYVHIMARKLNLPFSKTVNRRELWNIFKLGGHSFISIFVILVLLTWGFTPALVGVLGCVIVVIVSWMRKHTSISIIGILRGFKKGALLALLVSVACVTAGIIVGVVGQTGLGLQVTNSLLSLSQSTLFGVFVLTAYSVVYLTFHSICTDFYEFRCASYYGAHDCVLAFLNIKCYTTYSSCRICCCSYCKGKTHALRVASIQIQ